MKLTMKNDYTFQKVSGYPDDPKMMSTDEVKEELARWSYVIGSWMEGDRVDLDQIVGLDAFLSALATDEVEYEEPLNEYWFMATFEYQDSFRVVAQSQEQADTAAKGLFESYTTTLPARINETRRFGRHLDRIGANAKRIA